MPRGNLKNIQPTEANTEKAIRGLKRAYERGKLTKAQYEGLVRGAKKRLANAQKRR